MPERLMEIPIFRRWRYGVPAILDEFCLSVAQLLPLRLRYWVTMIELGYASRSSDDVPATPLGDIIKHLRAPRDHQRPKEEKENNEL